MEQSGVRSGTLLKRSAPCLEWPRSAPEARRSRAQWNSAVIKCKNYTAVHNLLRLYNSGEPKLVQVQLFCQTAQCCFARVPCVGTPTVLLDLLHTNFSCRASVCLNAAHVFPDNQSCLSSCGSTPKTLHFGYRSLLDFHIT